MKPITFATSYPSHQQTTLVADVVFPTMAFLDVPTVDGRRLWGPSRGEISIRLPVPIMTDFGGRYRPIGAVLSVTIMNHVLAGSGVLTEELPTDKQFWPGVDVDGSEMSFTKRGHRVRFEKWRLAGVTLRAGGKAWEALPPVTITPRTGSLISMRVGNS